jgi:hypothetical protein
MTPVEYFSRCSPYKKFWISVAVLAGIILFLLVGTQAVSI